MYMQPIISINSELCSLTLTIRFKQTRLAIRLMHMKIVLMKSDVCSLNYAGQLINGKGSECDSEMPQSHTVNQSWHHEEETKIQSVT